MAKGKMTRCAECGKPFAAAAKACPYCGAKNRKRKKVSPIFAIIVFCICCALIGLMGKNLDEPSPPKDDSETQVADNEQSSEPTQDDILAFDERSWEDFKVLYKSHNNFMDAIDKYSNGDISGLSFYNICEETKEYFANASLSFRYGADDYQTDYLSPFISMAISDQMAAEAFLKYLDTFKTSDLSDAEKNIKTAKEALTVIASNRGKLLVDAGLSDEEIHAKVEADTADLDE